MRLQVMLVNFQVQWDFLGPINGTPYPDYSHKKSLKIVGEVYHKRVPLFGVPGITLDKRIHQFLLRIISEYHGRTKR